MNRLVRVLLILGLVLSLFAFLACDREPVEEDPSKENPPEENPPEETPKEVKYVGYDEPCLVEPLYSQERIVADVVATDKPYYADPTGEKDATGAIQKAIQRAYDMGGGTVYLPSGNYRVCGNITVLPFVSLVGDYDPNGDGSHGTVILADVASTEETLPGLFSIGGSAGVRGLSVYYPAQDVNSPRPYPFTFSIPGSTAGAEYYMLSSVENCTVFNGYRGVWAGSVNEQMNIHDVKGTFLCRALELYDSADASSIRNVTATPDAWANCALGKASRADILKVMGQNEAFVFGDIEWAYFQSLTCEGYETGMHIVQGPRAKFSGILYDCRLLSCTDGVIVDDIDTRTGYGMGFCGGEIDATDFAVKNNTKGKVQLVGTTYEGFLSGATEDPAELDSVPEIVRPAEPMPAAIMKSVTADRSGKKDCSAVIQAALDSLKETGGIVYLPAGIYRLENPLTVPDGVELRGAGMAPIRDQMSLSLGTRIFSLCNIYCEDGETAGSTPAVITLGKKSGFRNIVLTNSSRDLFYDYVTNGNQFPEARYLIRGTGDGAYVLNSTVMGAINGIEMDGANHYNISHVSLLAYQTGIHLNVTNGGFISDILTNVTIGIRNRWWGMDARESLFPNGWEPNFEKSIKDDPEAYSTVHMLMDELTQVLYDSCSDEIAIGVFSYGAKHTLRCVDSKVTGINIGKDCYWVYKVKTPMLVAEYSTLTVYNQHRYNGVSYSADDESTLRIYDRVTIGEDESSVIKE